MIVRILTEGQFEVPEADLDVLNRLDDELMRAVEQRDEAAFSKGLEALLGRVREHGSSCSDEFLAESDFVLPAADTTLDEVAELLGSEGLVPG